MRIIAGSLKGRRLEAPDWPGLRPTSDKLRETLFNVLGARVDGARVLDGYAGTGAVGIEALSRGAAHVTFVERDPRAASLVAENLAACGVSDRHAIIRMGFEGAGRRLSATPFDVIFLDPPYGAPALLEALAAAEPLVGPATLLVVEHARRDSAPEAAGTLQRTRVLSSGDSALAFYRKKRGAERGVGAPRATSLAGCRGPRQQNRYEAFMKDVVAIYPGSFDPLTNGHVDIIQRGSRLFDRIVIAVLVNLEKAPLFTVPERVELAREVFHGWTNVEVDTFDGLLVDYARRKDATVIVRGLRAVSDFEYELQMALMNRRLNPDVETVFMMPAEPYTYLSSRLVKEVVALGGSVRGLVPDSVEARLREKKLARETLRA